MNLAAIFSWIAEQVVTCSILGLLLLVILVVFLLRTRKLKLEGAQFKAEAEQISALRSTIEQLGSTGSGFEAIADIHACIREPDISDRVKDSVSEYLQMLQATGRIYDPELFIRQKFKQLSQERLLRGGDFFIHLGLVGTFLGLVIGLVCLDASDAKALFASVATMLSSMGLAFVSSLAGLVAALFYQRRCSKYEDQYEQWEDGLSSLLSRTIGSIVIVDAESQLGEVAKALGTSLSRLAGLIEDMRKSSKQMAASSKNLEATIVALQDAAVKMTSGSFNELNSMSASIASSTKKLANSLPRLVQDNLELRRKLDGTIDELSTMSKNLSGAIGTMVGTSIHRHITDLCESIEQLVGKIDQQRQYATRAR